MISWIYLSLVKKFFALEVLEIVDGSVEIVGVVCEVGYWSKIVVRSIVFGFNVKGVCIGFMG